MDLKQNAELWDYFGRSCNQNFSILKQVKFFYIFFNCVAMLSGSPFYLAVLLMGWTIGV